MPGESGNRIFIEQVCSVFWERGITRWKPRPSTARPLLCASLDFYLLKTDLMTFDFFFSSFKYKEQTAGKNELIGKAVCSVSQNPLTIKLLRASDLCTLLFGHDIAQWLKTCARHAGSRLCSLSTQKNRTLSKSCRRNSSSPVPSHFLEVNYRILHLRHISVFAQDKFIQEPAITASDDISTLQRNNLTFP